MQLSKLVCCLLLLLGSCGFALAETAQVVGLAAALEASVRNHPAVKGKLAELAAQGYQLDAAKANRYPTFSGQIRKQNGGEEYGSVLLRQPLWAFGKIDTPIAQQKAQQKVELMGLLQVQRQLLEQTAAAYAQIRGIGQQLQVADENIIELQNLYQRIVRRQTGQLASEADVRMAFSRLTQAQSQRERIVGELQVARAQLRALTLVEVDTSVPVAQLLSALPGRATVEQMARKNHADIRFKQERIQVSKLNVKLEKISSTPTLYAEVARDFLDSSVTDETRVGISFEGSLNGAGLGIVGRVKSASAQVDAARQDLWSTRNDVELRIDSLLTNLSLQTRLQRSQQISVDAVQETKESYLRQYDSGRKSWLEVLNIQRELTEQRLQLVQANSDWQILSLRVAALIGLLDARAGIATEAAN